MSLENITGDVTVPHSVQKRLHWVRIKKNHHELIYTRIDLPSKVFLKWMWFFRYRAALYQVQHPKAFIELEHGSVLADIQKEEMMTHIGRQIVRQRNSIAAQLKKRAYVIANWNELLPVQDEPIFIKHEGKIEDGIIRLFNLCQALKKVSALNWSMALWNEHYK